MNKRWGWMVAGGGILLLGFAIESTWVQDTWKGMGYQPDGEMAEIEREIGLTNTGKRVFMATRPALKDANGFNEKCGEHDDGVSVLGCYADGQIYIYRITDEQLVAANKVTAAHELLHAVWERMGAKERGEVGGWLNEVREKNAEWFKQELETYGEEDLLEEVYTRAGTKLEELPEELEKHYGKWFQDRKAIVKMYREYEAPFENLRDEIGKLYNEIEGARAEIEAERANYLRGVEELDARVERFNRCAGTVNCFSAGEFEAQRSGLVAEKDALEAWRARLNEKIDQNNGRIDTYTEKQEMLGGLYEKMDSNVKKEGEL